MWMLSPAVYLDAYPEPKGWVHTTKLNYLEGRIIINYIIMVAKL
jgi:hypothetical protein